MQNWINQFGRRDESLEGSQTVSRQKYARQLYQSLQKQQDKIVDPQICAKEDKPYFAIEDKAYVAIEDVPNRVNYTNKKGICPEHALLFLEGLSAGRNIGKIRRQNPILEQYPMNTLKNMPKVTLLKLSKIFIELLPKKYVSLNPLQFYQKYFRTHEMLQFFKLHNINLLQTFQKLFFIKAWQRKNNEYLKRGYALDYLPSEITEKLTQLPKVYDDIVHIYNTFGYKLKTRQKRVKNEKKTEPVKFSLAQEATMTGYEQEGSELISSIPEDSIFLSGKSFF